MTLKKSDSISYIVVREKFYLLLILCLRQQAIRGVKGKLPLAHNKLLVSLYKCALRVFWKVTVKQK